MDLIDVVLPNGTTIADVPKDIDRDVLMDLAISNGYATIEDFNEPETLEEVAVTAEPLPTGTTTSPAVNPQRRGSTVGTTSPDEGGVMSWMKENMEVPLGVVGGIAGTALGAPFGPVGMFVGGTVGSSIGTGGGKLVSDELTGEDLKYAEALEEAVLSMGFDVATLGLGKAIKPAWVAGKKALGFTPREAAEQLVKELDQPAGSRASLQATQNILEEGGATLTPSQVGAGGSALLAEKIGRVGIFSARAFEDNAAKVNEITSDALSETINKLAVNSGGSAEEIAEQTMGIIRQGREALNTNYSNSLDQLAALSGNVQNLSLGKHIYATNAFVSKNMKGGILDLDPATVKFIDDDLGPMLGDNMALKTNLDGLIAIDKQITNRIQSRFGGAPGTPNYNPSAQRELTILAEQLREATYNSLKKSDPAMAAKYKAMKDAFAEGVQGILPKINNSFVTKASKGDYKSLGMLLTGAGNINQVLAFKKSLRESFKQIDKAGGDAGQFIAFQEADALIKKGFLQKLFPNAGTPSFDVTQYANLAKRLSDPTEAAKFKAILGQDYAKIKQLSNLMAEASVSPKSNIGELAFRGAEYKAGRELSGVLQGGAAMASGVVGAPFVLGAPIVLSKMALNPKRVNQLIAFENTTFKSSEAMEAAAQRIVADVVNELTEEEQAQLKNWIRQGNQKAPVNPQQRGSTVRTQ